ncbi:hypothetical protein FNH22_30455 [Fulvivirga sp. M361]|uniref:tetratricopeptide repeat protein n=1 Tax=Fulvivirga sp. M361 TaxID=2594266 RepID=UPI00117AC2C2|nr:hypothetical protein [Fulvivirga sp. M361]TRX47143.1 hypothetical protein FNH22_30455 [Fulvivirga sp. M361]
MRNLALLTALTVFAFSCKQQSGKTYQAPLLEGLGSHTITITTDSEIAQMFFNQGLILAYGFNHDEALRSFEEVVRQDPRCAMGYWGIAYVLGPNYNMGMEPSVNQRAYDAAQKALKLSENVKMEEKVLIESIAARYLPEPSTDRTSLDMAYSVALANAFQQFPDNDDIAVMYAESLMDIHPWDLYNLEGEAKPWTPEILKAIEAAIALNPNNPMATHLYIHATEASNTPELALPIAGKLAELTPGAGHLVHMPSHTYIRTGDYHLGTLINEKAAEVDSLYVTTCKVQGIYPLALYPHNIHFLAACAALEGNGAKAIEAAFSLAEIVDKEVMKDPAMSTLQHYYTIPYNILVKFAQWEKIVKLPKPELAYPEAIWSYAQGMAYIGLGKYNKANECLLRLEELLADPVLSEITVWDINSVDELVSIAHNILKAEIVMNENKWDQAVMLLEQAVTIEDKLNYNEPPDWFFSVRHVLGEVYMELERYQDAERVYREDLLTFRKNGFALNGLYHSLLKQGNEEAATIVQSQRDEAWKYADSKLKYSRVDPKYRKDLAIKVKEDSPNALITFAMSFCGLK